LKRIQDTIRQHLYISQKFTLNLKKNGEDFLNMSTKIASKKQNFRIAMSSNHSNACSFIW
jgi:hypothetical protein